MARDNAGKLCPTHRQSSIAAATPSLGRLRGSRPTVASTPLEVLARVACTRHKAEDFFEDAKSDLGMAPCETRSWVGRHHHMSLVATTHLFITLTRRDLGKKRRN